MSETEKGAVEVRIFIYTSHDVVIGVTKNRFSWSKSQTSMKFPEPLINYGFDSSTVSFKRGKETQQEHPFTFKTNFLTY